MLGNKSTKSRKKINYIRLESSTEVQYCTKYDRVTQRADLTSGPYGSKKGERNSSEIAMKKSVVKQQTGNAKSPCGLVVKTGL